MAAVGGGGGSGGENDLPTHSGSSGDEEGQLPAFLSKLAAMLKDETAEPYICWGKKGDTIFIKDPTELARSVLPKHFKHSNFASFVRQLNLYGFSKTTHDSDRSEFRNKLFVRHKPELMMQIRRKTPQRLPPKSPAGTALGVHRATHDLDALFTEVQTLNARHHLMEDELVNVKTQNQALWQEVVASRQRQEMLQQKLSKVVYFMMGAFEHSKAIQQSKRARIQGQDERHAGPIVGTYHNDTYQTQRFVQQHARPIHQPTHNHTHSAPAAHFAHTTSQLDPYGMPQPLRMQQANREDVDEQLGTMAGVSADSNLTADKWNAMISSFGSELSQLPSTSISSFHDGTTPIFGAPARSAGVMGGHPDVVAGAGAGAGVGAGTGAGGGGGPIVGSSTSGDSHPQGTIAVSSPASSSREEFSVLGKRPSLGSFVGSPSPHLATGGSLGFESVSAEQLGLANDDAAYPFWDQSLHTSQTGTFQKVEQLEHDLMDGEFEPVSSAAPLDDFDR